MYQQKLLKNVFALIIFLFFDVLIRQSNLAVRSMSRAKEFKHPPEFSLQSARFPILLADWTLPKIIVVYILASISGIIAVRWLTGSIIKKYKIKRIKHAIYLFFDLMRLNPGRWRSWVQAKLKTVFTKMIIK